MNRAIADGSGSSPHTRGAPCTSRPPGVPRWDHPRIRGEHPASTRECRIRSGSSPHTRGALDEIGIGNRGGGIIPAYAGSTSGSSATRGSARDHPRIRGEHKRAFKNARIVIGSSPHTRGAPRSPCRRRRRRRIIPAYAGSTRQQAPTPRPYRGSSPHTRGAHRQDRGAWTVAGIIPAYAGSTNAGRERRLPSRDHPRIRGEHQVGRVLAHVAPGIIPAYAGSTRRRRRSASRGRDHPRIRGEHVNLLIVSDFPPGSSPHTRGARPVDWHVAAADGIIPAYAGSTSRILWRCRGVGDHPRIRGEHSTTATST